MTTPRLIGRLRAGTPQHLVAYGTSLTAERTWRVWRRSGGAWVAMLRERLEREFPGLARVTNAARWGADSAWGARRLERRVLRLDPDLTLLEFGINDADRRRSVALEGFRRNLDSMLDRLTSGRPDRDVLLLTMNPALGRHAETRPRLEAFYGAVREAASERDLPLADLHVAWRAALAAAGVEARLLPDGIHPGPEACRDVVLPGLLDALGLPGRR